MSLELIFVSGFPYVRVTYWTPGHWFTWVIPFTT